MADSMEALGRMGRANGRERSDEVRDALHVLLHDAVNVARTADVVLKMERLLKALFFERRATDFVRQRMAEVLDPGILAQLFLQKSDGCSCSLLIRDLPHFFLERDVQRKLAIRSCVPVPKPSRENQEENYRPNDPPDI